MAKTIKVGFVGTGGIAQAHIRGLLNIADVEFAGFCDVVKEKADKAADEHGGKAFKAAEKMYDSVELNAVYICLPPFAHGKAEMGAAERGIPFIVEKPVDMDLEQAEAIAATVKKAGLITAAAYMNRYRKSVAAAKKLFEDAPPVIGWGGWFGGSPPEDTTFWLFNKKKSGGQIVEQTTHTIDLARYMCGDAVEVFAHGTKAFNKHIPGYKTDDASAVSVQFRGGSLITFFSSWATSTGPGVFLSLYGTNSSALFTGWDHSVSIVAPGKKPKDIVGEPAEKIFELEDRAFIKAVKTGDASSIMSSYPDGVESLKISLAANQAISTGQAQKI